MEPAETIEVEDTRVSCDGGGGALGHPMIYLNLGDGGNREGTCVPPYRPRQLAR